MQCTIQELLKEFESIEPLSSGAFHHELFIDSQDGFSERRCSDWSEMYQERYTIYIGSYRGRRIRLETDTHTPHSLTNS